jgi:hypothetical protein
MAVHFHEILDGVEWRVVGRISLASNTSFKEVSTKLVLWTQLLAKVRDREVIGPDLTRRACNRLVL